MARRRKTGFLKRLIRRVITGPSKAQIKALVPSNIKMIGKETYYEAASEWKAAKEHCVSDPQLAAVLAEKYRNLEHPLLLQERQEEKHLFEQRQRDAERQAEISGRPVREVERRVFPVTLKPEDAAAQLLILGSRTPKPKIRRP